MHLHTELVLDQRKSWYGNTADAYNRTRPRYPQETISRVIELAQLSPHKSILELGYGVSFLIFFMKIILILGGMEDAIQLVYFYILIG
ncbi:MAG: hypothetical protein KME60_31020 [Cyanomargarita calcarea GSE-NOS-MK-12-04C]|uniref:Uncharacterized protein n=1 Tax=Cyanomargarita calcarea GSE-NOS-MK-12-04C TaxID=2839659 RepID=A0A951QW66_9CYAN|nr:hypothetical protein [Cyanomargarita calcarea GSE-NOS-MK-12-04C]